jgi:hypothetical protein
LKVTEVVYAHGHENVTSTNKTTFEITKETHLTKQGDCIIALGSSKGANDLSAKFKKTAQNEKARIRIRIEAGRKIEVVIAWGSPQLTFTHPTDLVVRKSNYVCSRTLAIQADKAANDFSRSLVEKLRSPKQQAKIILTVEGTT